MKSFHIKAYTFQADIMCCDCIAEFVEFELRQMEYTTDQINEIASLGPGYDSGVYAWRSEALLKRLANHWNIDLDDYYSFDSDEFPKVVFADQIEGRERCGECGETLV